MDRLPTIPGRGLRLRELGASDAAGVRAVFGDPEVLRTMPVRPRTTDAEALEMIEGLRGLAAELGMEALFEVHDADELARVGRLNPGLVGVNNRDLRTFVTSLETSVSLANALPPGCVAVSESGFCGPHDLRRVHHAGYQGFLVGEHLMRAADQGQELARLYGRNGQE